MANLSTLNFSNEDLKEASSFTLFDAGITTFLVTGSDMREFNGVQYLDLHVQGMDGANIQKTGTISLGIVSSSSKQQVFARNILFSISKACGFETIPPDSAHLHGRQFQCEVTVQEYDKKNKPGEKGKSNGYKAFKPATAQSPQMQQQPATQPGQTAAAGQPAPW